MLNSIDVIIPSFRVQKEYIIPILDLVKPAGVSIKFYLVVDNPELEIDPDILARIDGNSTYLIVNKTNLGASLTRNIGIDSGNGEWILFLDDDIKIEQNLLCIYSEAIQKHPDEIGFIGLVTLPPATTEFTKATLASGSAGIFNVAEITDHFAWGATANMIVSRKAIGSIRFSVAYPKFGGGEDVDFFLKVRKNNDFKDYKTLKQAQVWHPWWDESKVNFKRPFRYGKGTGFLIKLNPEYARYDFPSTPETLLISFLFLLTSLFIAAKWTIPIALFILGVIVIDLIASLINSLKKNRTLSIKALLYMYIMKLAYDLGVLTTNINQRAFSGFLKRFNYNGSLKKDHFTRLNTFKIIKIILSIGLISYILLNYL